LRGELGHEGGALINGITALLKAASHGSRGTVLAIACMGPRVQLPLPKPPLLPTNQPTNARSPRELLTCILQCEDPM
jgi:hypothetical protein